MAFGLMFHINRHTNKGWLFGVVATDKYNCWKLWLFFRLFFHFNAPQSSGLNEKLSCGYACDSDWCSRILSTPDSRTHRTTNLNFDSLRTEVCVLSHPQNFKGAVGNFCMFNFSKPSLGFCFHGLCTEAHFRFPLGASHSGSWYNWKDVRSLLC